MESISDTLWDVVICGTGLQQSLLALALSRSDKKILHVDPNEYYGGAEAALSLDEADAWAAAQPAASVTRPVPTGASPTLAASRQYALALAPQFLHARSTLVSQLVSSQAYRQLEFLAVSSFFVLERGGEGAGPPLSITRVPATREDVFADTTMPARSKRQLMKFLKFVLAYDEDHKDRGDANETPGSTSSTVAWQAQASEPLGGFLQTAFGLDDALRDRVLALTLSLDGASVTVAEGLARLHQHIQSMGAFGAGFAAVYPKWGGCSEVAQVACRASAVGGAVYMLGVGIDAVHADGPKKQKEPSSEEAEQETQQEKQEKQGTVEVALTTDVRVKTKLVVTVNGAAATQQRLSRLVAVVGAPLPFLFAPTVEGAPVAGGAVVAIPAGRPVLADGSAPEHPIFVLAHSSDTGECPPGQCILYFTTLYTPNAATVLENALASVLAALARRAGAGSGGNGGSNEVTGTPVLSCLYKLYYEQPRGGGTDGTVADSRGATSFVFPPLPVDLTVPDASLDAVRRAWERVVGDGAGDAEPYMVFENREKNMADDEDD